MTTHAPRTAPHIDTGQLRAVVDSADAPDVVLAVSQGGDRTVVTGGTAPERAPAGDTGSDHVSPAHRGAAGGRERLRFEVGSVTKTFTGLLLAALAQQHAVTLGDRVSPLLSVPSDRHRRRDAITLFHLATHTAGLPRLPWHIYLQPPAQFRANPHAWSTEAHLLRAFARCRPRSTPGARWHYSNFGGALLGPALSAATAEPFDTLLASEVLEPLGLTGATLAPRRDRRDATGHDSRVDGEVAPFAPGGWGSAGALRATTTDLLTYLEALLFPDRYPVLQDALRYVTEPVLRRGRDRAETHTLTWFQHPSAEGPFFFHSGATPGQQAFLAFKPATETAVVALANQRYRAPGTLQLSTHDLLC